MFNTDLFAREKPVKRFCLAVKKPCVAIPSSYFHYGQETGVFQFIGKK